MGGDVLDIKWSDPIKTENSKGLTIYQREWIIPIPYRSQFFEYWAINKGKLKDKGCSVTKRNKDWVLIETSLKDKSSINSLNTSIKQENNTIDNSPLPSYEVKNIEGLRPWQIESVSKLVSSINKWGSAVDGSEIGSGKSYVSCAVARELNMDIFVVCPKTIMESWKRVIKNHFKMWGKCVGIINYESLRTGKTNSPFASYVKRRDTHRKEFIWKIPKNTLIIWDEAHKLKNHKTKNSETCDSALKHGYKMLFCSATIATNPLELKTVGQCIQLFKTNKEYYTWLYAHGVSKGRFGLEFNGNKNALLKLHKDVFDNRGIRLCRDSIPNFPKSEIITQCYEMEKETTDTINQIYSDLQIELLKLESVAKKDKGACALTAILRSRMKIELLKIPLFIEMVEEGLENNMSVVIFCNFTETINALSERLNTKCIINGDIVGEERQKNLDDFQSDKERVIIVNCAAGSVGISLHDLNGNYPRLSLISPSYSAVHMRQATGRVWRDGSKTTSLQRIIFVSNTIEVKVCEAVNKKLNNLDLLNDGDLQSLND